jgi:hypothetical protein
MDCKGYYCLRYRVVGPSGETVTCKHHSFLASGEGEKLGVCGAPGDVVLRDPFIAERMNLQYSDSLKGA